MRDIRAARVQAKKIIEGKADLILSEWQRAIILLQRGSEHRSPLLEQSDNDLLDALPHAKVYDKMKWVQDERGDWDFHSTYLIILGDKLYEEWSGSPDRLKQLEEKYPLQKHTGLKLTMTRDKYEQDDNLNLIARNYPQDFKLIMEKE